LCSAFLGTGSFFFVASWAPMWIPLHRRPTVYAEKDQVKGRGILIQGFDGRPAVPGVPITIITRKGLTGS